MRISVVVPAYNEEQYLENCLNSLVKQTVQPDEIIVVNNNSTDKTVAIAKKYPVRIVNETEQGMTPARNRGFNEAKYEIIARTDSDTIVPPDWIERIKNSFETDKELIALSGPAHFYDLPDVVIQGKWTVEALFSHIRLFKQIMKHDCLYGPNMAVRRSIWRKVKNTVCLDDKEVHEDIDLAIHLSQLGKVKFDYTLLVESSFRRWKKAESYIDYTNRAVKSINKHKSFIRRPNGKDIVRKSKKLIKNFLSAM